MYSFIKPYIFSLVSVNVMCKNEIRKPRNTTDLFGVNILFSGPKAKPDFRSIFDGDKNITFVEFICVALETVIIEISNSFLT